MFSDINKSALLVTKEQLLAIIEAQADIIGWQLQLNAVMNKMIALAQQLTFASGAVLEMVDGSDMVYTAATGKANDQLGLRLSRATSLSGRCIELNQVLNCKDALADPRVDRAACEKIGLLSMLVVPLRHDHQLVGVLKVFSARKAAFDDVDIQILELAAIVISAAIHAAQ